MPGEGVSFAVLGGEGGSVREVETDGGAVGLVAAEELVAVGVGGCGGGGDGVEGADVFVVPLEVAAWFCWVGGGSVSDWKLVATGVP